MINLELERLINDAKQCSRCINMQTNGLAVQPARLMKKKITVYPYINKAISGSGRAYPSNEWPMSAKFCPAPIRGEAGTPPHSAFNEITL